MSTPGKSSAKKPRSPREVSKATKQPSIMLSSFIERAVAGAGVSSATGKLMPAVVASVHYTKTDRSPRKLRKKRAVPDFAASVSVPLQEQQVAVPLQEAPIRTGWQEQSHVSKCNVGFEMDFHPARRSSSHPLCPQDQESKQALS